MPLIQNSTYTRPAWALNGHLQTIIPALFRKVNFSYDKREEIITPDDDFLDIDLKLQNSNKIIVLSHGLEGDTFTAYMLGMANAFYTEGFDVLAWNSRSCSGRMNRGKHMYHSGLSNDLRIVIDYVLSAGKYETIVLAGFSMGGNITLKYLGEEGKNIDPKIKAATVFSVPVDLGACGAHLERRANRLYLNRFLKTLKQKVKLKQQQFPGIFKNIDKLNEVKDFAAFDEMFTAPLHGFKDAKDYYEKNSSRHFLDSIYIPVLLVNALNDPFLPPACYPFHEAKNNTFLYLETPAHGGHVGFLNFSLKGNFWSENRALAFVKAHWLTEN